MPPARFICRTRSLTLSQAPESAGLSAWLSFITTPGLAAAGQQRLLKAYAGDPAQVLRKAPAKAREFRLNAEQLAHWQNPAATELRQAQAWLEHDGNHLLLLSDPRYPTRLLDLADPPVALFCQGDLDLLSRPQLAMVGSRNPSPAGARHARQFAHNLAGRGLTITSGMALGIDAMAHQGALAADGLTVAVTGTGLDQVYPTSNWQLAAAIREQGLIISEFSPGMPARKENFPRRNRIIAALSCGTLVVEAALRSGSLITARLAGELGREVFAMPGSVDNPMARGCHYLIRNGAKLVETADDILEELGPIMDNAKPQAPVVAATSNHSDLDPEYQTLLNHLDNAPRSIDELVELTGLAVDSVSSMLLILELQGAVASAPGGGFQKLQS